MHEYAPDSILSKNRTDLGAVTIAAELIRLDAKANGAEVQGHFLRVVDAAACVTRMWHELGAELWKLTNFNFYHDLDIEKCG